METRQPEPMLDAVPPDGDIQRADYAAACDFLAMPFGLGLALALLILLPQSGDARITPYLVTVSALFLAFVGWSLAARAFERRRGEDGRTILGILEQTLIRLVAPMSIGFVALSLTTSLLLAYALAAFICVMADIFFARLRRADA